jgi:hypothetical protein
LTRCGHVSRSCDRKSTAASHRGNGYWWLGIRNGRAPGTIYRDCVAISRNYTVIGGSPTTRASWPVSRVSGESPYSSWVTNGRTPPMPAALVPKATVKRSVA